MTTLEVRHRIGLLVPSSNSILENDLHASLDKARYSVHTARMHLVETLRPAEKQMIEEHAPRAADDLATVYPDLVIFGCTSGGSLGGTEYDRSICAELGRIAGAPAIGALQAVTEALDRRNLTRLAVVTPFVDDLTNSIASAATTNSRKIVGAYGMGISVNAQLADPTPEEIIDFALSHICSVEFDGLLVPCTNFRALEAKNTLEETLRVPVITSNSAILEAIAFRFQNPTQGA